MNETKEIKAHRIKAVLVTPEYMASFLTTGEKHFNVDIGLPKDVRFCNAAYSYPQRCFILYFEHESFDLVPVGQCAPETQIICSDVLKKATNDLNNHSDQG